MNQPNNQSDARLSSKPTTSLVNVGFITYNTLPGIQNGWLHRNGRSALVVQDTNGKGALSDGKRTRSSDEIREEISSLWRRAEEALPELDHLVIYVGANGSERAIALVAKLPVEKLTFVGCGCGIERKELMLHAAGLGGARRIGCECGGHRTMVSLIETHLREGLRT